MPSSEVTVFLAFMGLGIVFLIPWCVGVGTIVAVIGDLDLWTGWRRKKLISNQD